MKKIFALFVVIHGLFSSFAQTSDKSLQISAPAGYRVYINTEFKGVTSDSQDGLLVKKIQPIIFLEVKKQNNIVYSDSVIIENEILEINLYKEIIEEKPKTAYDYWQEYFDILNNERSVKNYMERNVSFLMPNKPLDATRFLADLRSYNMTESIEFNGLPIMKDNAGISNLFYYGHLTDIKSFSGTKSDFFILYFIKIGDKTTAVLRMQTEKNMQNVINSLTQTNTLTQSQTSNPNISYAALDLNKYNSTRFEYYPKLGILNLMFDLRNDKLLHLNLNLIEGEESFDWRSRSRTDVRNVIDYYSGNLSSKENKKMEATMDRNTFEGKLYKRYW